MIGLADLLLWQRVPGIALPLFIIALAGMAQVMANRQASRVDVCKAWGILLLALIPTVDLVQTVSVIFAIAGLFSFVAIIAGQGAWAALHFAPSGARQLGSLPFGLNIVQ